MSTILVLCILCLLLENTSSSRFSNLLLSAISTNTDGDDSMTFRIRDSSGVMNRMTIKGSETIAELHLKAVQTIGISEVAESANHTFTFCGMTCSSLDLQSNTTRISDTSLSHGDIIEIQSGTESNKSPGSTRPRRVPLTVSARKKTFSMSDIAKRKESLVKIKRQKANSSHIVRLSPETSRILKRVSDKKGVALLLGRHVKSTSKPLTSKQVTIRSRSDTDEKEYFDVVSVCELFVHNGNKDERIVDNYPAKIADCKELIDRVKKLAKSLQLDVVGCCIGLPSTKSDTPPPRGIKPKQAEKSSTWTSAHIHSSLQLFERLQPDSRNSSEFIILSVNDEEKKVEKGKYIGGGGKLGKGKGKSGKKHKHKQQQQQQQQLGSALGISIEAYKLTDQAALLHSTGVLPATPLESATAAKHQDARDGKKGTSTLRPVAVDADEEEEVFLARAVLVKNDETQKVSSILFSVPLAVTSLSGPTAVQKKQKNPRHPRRGHWVLPLFEHSYPSPHELEEDTKTAEVAKQYLIRVLRKIDAKKANPTSSMCELLPETADRLRDSQLLLYLHTIITGDAFHQLCRGLMLKNCDDDSSVFLPADVAISLDMIKETLQYSGGDTALDDGE